MNVFSKELFTHLHNGCARVYSNRSIKETVRLLSTPPTICLLRILLPLQIDGQTRLASLKQRGKKILSAAQSLPTTPVPNNTEILHSLEQLKRREVSWGLHIASLAEYAKAQRIPRGLRVMLQPALFKDSQEFRQKWQGILNRCSLDLIALTIQQLQTGSKELKQQIRLKEEEYMGTTDTSDQTLRELEHKMERMQQEILQIKLLKFKRDTRDYEQGEVYTWKESRRVNRRVRTSSAFSTDRASEQSSDAGHISSASSHGVSMSFLGEGRKRRYAKPGGDAGTQQGPTPNKQKKSTQTRR
ncbi:uncharacterized protein LOC121399722 [Xenopus laevis]|uniref:Uncharacterized protein LOC121399722 n=1 Tax=Xenopus laevis TaxID=8355 RepID=A0A8J1M7B5_XENLA|nr:uncharacterized protein LOC121399722 [Xenopus laevis]